jgi:hypothetical protein
MSICLRLKRRLCIQKNAYIYVLQVTLAIYKIYKKGTIRVRHPYNLSDMHSSSTPHSVQRSHPPCHQYLHPKKLHLYGCGGSQVRIGESVSSLPQ